MKYLSLVFLLILFVGSNAQNWAPKTAKWYYPGEVWGISTGYILIENVKDTLIQSKLCQKLSKTYYSYNFISSSYDTTLMGFEYTYSDSNKVFNYRYSQFFTLYDFNALPGDTWEVAGNILQFNCDSTGIVQVDSIGTLVINSDTLKYLCVSGKGNPHWQFSGKLVEKIGCLGYMFPEPFCVLDHDEGGPLLCYSDSVWGKYQTGITDSCTELYSTISEGKKLNSEIEIYPNPFTDNIHISLGNSAFEIIYIDIRSIHGQLLKSKSTRDNYLTLEVSALPRGPYFIRIKNKNQNITHLICKI